MTKVMCFGTFDLVHLGHLEYFKQAKQLGDFLIVVVARDKTVLKTKGQYPRFTEEQRREKIENIGIIDKVMLGNTDDVYQVIKDEQPDILALGYDQTHFVDQLKQKIHEFGLDTKIFRMKPFKPEEYKSSKLKEELE